MLFRGATIAPLLNPQGARPLEGMDLHGAAANAVYDAACKSQVIHVASKSNASCARIVMPPEPPGSAAAAAASGPGASIIKRSVGGAVASSANAISTPLISLQCFAFQMQLETPLTDVDVEFVLVDTTGRRHFLVMSTAQHVPKRMSNPSGEPLHQLRIRLPKCAWTEMVVDVVEALQTALAQEGELAAATASLAGGGAKTTPFQSVPLNGNINQQQANGGSSKAMLTSQQQQQRKPMPSIRAVERVTMQVHGACKLRRVMALAKPHAPQPLHPSSTSLLYSQHQQQHALDSSRTFDGAFDVSHHGGASPAPSAVHHRSMVLPQHSVGRGVSPGASNAAAVASVVPLSQQFPPGVHFEAVALHESVLVPPALLELHKQRDAAALAAANKRAAAAAAARRAAATHLPADTPLPAARARGGDEPEDAAAASPVPAALPQPQQHLAAKKAVPRSASLINRNAQLRRLVNAAEEIVLHQQQLQVRDAAAASATAAGVATAVPPRAASAAIGAPRQQPTSFSSLVPRVAGLTVKRHQKNQPGDDEVPQQPASSEVPVADAKQRVSTRSSANRTASTALQKAQRLRDGVEEQHDRVRRQIVGEEMERVERRLALQQQQRAQKINSTRPAAEPVPTAATTTAMTTTIIIDADEDTAASAVAVVRSEHEPREHHVGGGDVAAAAAEEQLVAQRHIAPAAVPSRTGTAAGRMRQQPPHHHHHHHAVAPAQPQQPQQTLRSGDAQLLAETAEFFAEQQHHQPPLLEPHALLSVISHISEEEQRMQRCAESPEHSQQRRNRSLAAVNDGVNNNTNTTVTTTNAGVRGGAAAAAAAAAAGDTSVHHDNSVTSRIVVNEVVDSGAFHAAVAAAERELRLQHAISANSNHAGGMMGPRNHSPILDADHAIFAPAASAAALSSSQHLAVDDAEPSAIHSEASSNAGDDERPDALAHVGGGAAAPAILSRPRSRHCCAAEDDAAVTEMMNDVSRVLSSRPPTGYNGNNAGRPQLAHAVARPATAASARVAPAPAAVPPRPQSVERALSLDFDIAAAERQQSSSAPRQQRRAVSAQTRPPAPSAVVVGDGGRCVSLRHPPLAFFDAAATDPAASVFPPPPDPTDSLDVRRAWLARGVPLMRASQRRFRTVVADQSQQQHDPQLDWRNDRYDDDDYCGTEARLQRVSASPNTSIAAPHCGNESSILLHAQLQRPTTSRPATRRSPTASASAPAFTTICRDNMQEQRAGSSGSVDYVDEADERRQQEAEQHFFKTHRVGGARDEIITVRHVPNGGATTSSASPNARGALAAAMERAVAGQVQPQAEHVVAADARAIAVAAAVRETRLFDADAAEEVAPIAPPSQRLDEMMRSAKQQPSRPPPPPQQQQQRSEARPVSASPQPAMPDHFVWDPVLCMWLNTVTNEFAFAV